MRYFVILFIVLAASAAFFSWSAYSVSDSPIVPSPTKIPWPYGDENELFDRVQKWRTDNGLPAYEKDQKLCEVAKERSNDLLNDYSHDMFLERPYYEKTGASALSENISNSPYPKQTLDEWLASASHAAALRDNFTHSCIACTDTYCSHIFARY